VFYRPCKNPRVIIQNRLLAVRLECEEWVHK
jgi:hypothetical protein